MAGYPFEIQGREVGSNTGLERCPRDISINARDLRPSRAGFLQSALFWEWQVKYNLLFVLGNGRGLQRNNNLLLLFNKPSPSGREKGVIKRRGGCLGLKGAF